MKNQQEKQRMEKEIIDRLNRATEEQVWLLLLFLIRMQEE